MQIEFIDAYPFEELQPTLERLCTGARRIDAAVAFVTKHGTETLLKLLRQPSPPQVRLVVSVRFPTDIGALCRLEPRLNGNLFIHTGYQLPEEEHADRGQFHSKVVLIETNATERSILVGSHNWTECGLRGVNIEAGVHIRCNEGDDIVRQVRSHIAGCIGRSERFDPTRERFYRTVQDALRVRGAGAPSAPFEGFEKCEALVIHAEAGALNPVPAPLRLFIPVADERAKPFFPVDRRVLLYLYPTGALLGHASPTATPTLFDGKVTMNNAAADAPVNQRAVNCLLVDLHRPIVNQEGTLNIPASTGGANQVVVRLDGKGPTRLPILHCAEQAPKLKLSVECDQIDRDRMATTARDEESLSVIGNGPGKPTNFVYSAPARLEVAARIRMPGEMAGDPNTEARLKGLAYASEFMRPEDVLEIRFEDPPPDMVFNRYVYRAVYRLTDESEARIQRQRPLIPD